MKKQYKNSEFNLTSDEVQILINAADNFRDRMIIESLYYPALRRFEVATMRVENVNFQSQRITIIGKGEKISPIPVGSIYPEYMATLKLFIGKRKTGYVFLSNRGTKLSNVRINQILKKISGFSGLENPNPTKTYINPHLLRHSQARRLKSNRFPIEFVQKYLRHSSMKTTMDEYGTLGINEMEKIAYSFNQERTRLLN